MEHAGRLAHHRRLAARIATGAARRRRRTQTQCVHDHLKVLLILVHIEVDQLQVMVMVQMVVMMVAKVMVVVQLAALAHAHAHGTHLDAGASACSSASASDSHAHATAHAVAHSQANHVQGTLLDGGDEALRRYIELGQGLAHQAIALVLAAAVAPQSLAAGRERRLLQLLGTLGYLRIDQQHWGIDGAQLPVEYLQIVHQIAARQVTLPSNAGRGRGGAGNG